MPLLVTEAIVLHAFDYLESSRIIRLLTREAGVQSVLARGARKSRGRYGSALDLFAEGSAQLYVKPNRELHNLAGFEISRTRGELAEDIGRFTAASTIAELALRFAGEGASPELYDTVADVLDRIARSAPDRTIEDGLSACWRIVSSSVSRRSFRAAPCVTLRSEMPTKPLSRIPRGGSCVRPAAGRRLVGAGFRPARGQPFASGSAAMSLFT